MGVDDAPFAREHRGVVLVVGAVFSGTRLEGILSTRVQRDGADATRRIVAMIAGSRFAPQVQAVLLQGIALAGFNVVDVHALASELDVAVLVVARRAPDLDAIRRVLLERVRGGRRKWALVERAGPMEPLAGVHVQRVGIERDEAVALIERLALTSRVPEPLRVAHLVAGGLATGESRGRV